MQNLKKNKKKIEMKWMFYFEFCHWKCILKNYFIHIAKRGVVHLFIYLHCLFNNRLKISRVWYWQLRAGESKTMIYNSSKNFHHLMIVPSVSVYFFILLFCHCDWNSLHWRFAWKNERYTCRMQSVRMEI